VTEAELLKRTKQLALRVMRLLGALPQTTAGRVISNQLMKCGTSVGANYRAACKGRSKAEFVAKLGIVEEEADESVYWMELIVEGGLLPERRVASLRDEAQQLVRIMAASRRSTIANRKL
jgi:four helix bundle protein